ncbi:MAG TPA: ester cyclase [Ktedonobacterales bacterium]|nr:ester cyclase [Ktedonobacterales bacterium]
MGSEDQVQLVRRLFDEGFSGGDTAVVDELMSEDFREHQHGVGRGREGVKALIRQLHSWFSDLTLTIEALAEDGDTIWARLKGRGTNTGPIMGHPPTGRRIEIDVIDIIRFSDGKMVEHWGVPDSLGMMQQVGLIPAPER